ncbi:diguanylate cyclase (GGDEF)-like protein [Duganella sp. SG902]|uniref:sensor domain-containing diguanylate cyclase n=1 Tax=Duganella sp. SG902 TaxID=2587016 RepID=UPI00159D93BA|nr:sensor domain-containing diguanylate cyclase [Duganella sp. SG902]NVM77736.1 diguanylate cyclase (GGDEF)-like protein [Duganella sp. SG902]
MRPVSSFFYSFKFKITALVIALVSFAGIGAGGISLLIAESELRLVIARQELSLLAGAAAFIDNDLQNKRQLLRSVTEEINNRGLGLDEIQAQLESHESLRDAFFNVNAFDLSGNLVASLRDRRAKRVNITERKYFQDTLRLQEGVLSAPFKSTLSGQPVVVLTQPLRDAEGRLTGILLGAIDLLRPSFSAQLDTLRAGADGYLFIVTDQGVFVHHPDKSRILERGDDGAGTLLEAALRTPEGWEDGILDDGVPVLLAHKHLREADWTIGLSYPVRSAFASMLSVRLRALLGATMLTAVAGLFGWLITKNLLRPLRRLHRHVEDISEGRANIAVFDVARKDEFGHLSRAFFGLSQRREQAELELHRLATTDVLTGINNRRMFDAFLPQALARAARSGQPVGLAILDIDHFKAINDTLGHAAGDQVLIEFARRLTTAVRTTDTVARLAGDEFVIVFEQLSSSTEMDVLGRKIIEAMQPPFPLAAGQREVRTSVGIAVTTSAASTAEEVMRAADQALYGVKAAGRNGYAVNPVGAERVVRVR